METAPRRKRIDHSNSFLPPPPKLNDVVSHRKRFYDHNITIIIIMFVQCNRGSDVLHITWSANRAVSAVRAKSALNCLQPCSPRRTDCHTVCDFFPRSPSGGVIHYYCSAHRAAGRLKAPAGSRLLFPADSYTVTSVFIIFDGRSTDDSSIERVVLRRVHKILHAPTQPTCRRKTIEIIGTSLQGFPPGATSSVLII